MSDGCPHFPPCCSHSLCDCPCFPAQRAGVATSPCLLCPWLSSTRQTAPRRGAGDQGGWYAGRARTKVLEEFDVVNLHLKLLGDALAEVAMVAPGPNFDLLASRRQRSLCLTHHGVVEGGQMRMLSCVVWHVGWTVPCVSRPTRRIPPSHR